MAKVNVLTFVLGGPTVATVKNQFRDTVRAFGRSAASSETGPTSIARAIDRSLRISPDAFDLDVFPAPDAPVRVVWQGSGKHGGLLFLVETGVLQSINLLLTGTSDSVDKQTITTARGFLHPVEPYHGCFEMIDAARRPLIASFCASAGGLTRSTEITLFSCASALFNEVSGRTLAHNATTGAIPR